MVRPHKSRTLVLAVLALGLLALGTLLINSAALLWPFLAHFSVTNEGEAPIELVPIGLSPSGEVVRVKLIWPHTQRSLPLEPGRKVDLAYDFEHVNLCWIAIKSRGGVKALRTDLSEDQCPRALPPAKKPACCFRPKATKLVVGSVDQLDTAPDDLVRVAGM